MGAGRNGFCPEKAVLEFLERFRDGIRGLWARYASHVPLEDALQEAALVAWEAAQVFDPAREASFQTLAWPRVVRRLQRLGLRDRTISIPARAAERMARTGEIPEAALPPLSLDWEDEGGQPWLETLLPADSEGDPLRILEEREEQEELQKILHQAWEGLTEEEQAAVALRLERGGGRGLPEPARRTGRRAMRKLRRRLRKACAARQRGAGRKGP